MSNGGKPQHAAIVQLPFPSTLAPNPRLADYYVDYDRVFQNVFPDYFIPEGSLWEMPLWVAHLTALADEAGLDSSYCDLSKANADVRTCVTAIEAATRPGDLVLMSPLAQNFELALGVSTALIRSGRRTVFGGNMAPLATAGQVSLVHRGQLDASAMRKVARLAGSRDGETVVPVRLGLAPDRITSAPAYRHLDGYRGQVPLLRLNASHGCLFQCSFCGDAWSRQLILVERRTLEVEVDELARRFPDTKLIYVGDKTFGQSKEAVRNLMAVFADRPGYRFIVQTHVMQVKPWVVDAMRELGVVAVELGFESGDSEMLKGMNKLSRGLDDYAEKVHLLHDAGLKVVLNVMGGLDGETEHSHRQTTQWLRDHGHALWLFNLYSFVPYPLIPDFPRLRDRIHNWNFADWREDAPPVYKPQHLTPERSWELFEEKVETAHRLVLATLASTGCGATR